MESKQIQSLIRLLDDRDPFVTGRVREQLIRLGEAAVPYLIEAVQQENLRLRSVAEELLQAVHPTLLREKFRALARAGKPEEPDLESGACLIMEYGRGRAAEPERVRTTLDELAAELKPRLHPGDTPQDTVRKLSEFLFQEQGFRGNTRNYFDPENSYLDSVLERKTGIPITLSLVCILIGRRLDLPVGGIGLPCHFITRFGDTESPVYFDPFHGGRVLTRDACAELVQGFGLKFEDRFLTPASPRDILVRMLQNLITLYNRIHDEEKSRQLTEYCQILLKAS